MSLKSVERGGAQLSEQLEGRKLNAVLSQLVETMGTEESWTGHTQVQKSCFFLQKMLNVPLGYDFELYLHGPYSFELKDDLEDMLFMEELGLRPRPGYGPSFFVTDLGKSKMEQSPDFLSEIDFVAKEIAKKDVRQLEQLSTAFFLMIQDNDLSEDEIPSEVNRLKPHIDVGVAKDALAEVKALAKQAEEYLNS